MGADPDFERMLNQVFAPSGAAAAHWQSLSELGILGVGVPEVLGGQGGTSFEQTAVHRAVGYSAVDLPVSEHLTAARLAAAAGLAVANEPTTIALPDTRDQLTLAKGQLSGRLHTVPFGDRAEWLVTVAGDEDGGGGCGSVVRLRLDQTQFRTDIDLAGRPSSEVQIQSVPVEVGGKKVAADLVAAHLRRARAGQMAGAIARVAGMSVDYASQREQFGRPIGEFQAVQAHLASLAQAAAMADLLVLRMASTADDDTWSFADECGWTMVVDCAHSAIAHGHQLHGAIGMTREYDLQRFTRCLHAWSRPVGTDDGVDRLVEAAQREGSVSTLIASI
jgi:acyl-CoA dehydrogenase